MRIAVVDHIGNHGGGSRVVRLLLPALTRIDPALQLVYLGNPSSIDREGLHGVFRGTGIRVEALRSLSLRGRLAGRSRYAHRAVDLLQTGLLSRHAFLPVSISGDTAREISSRLQRGFDLVFYPWPFLLRFPAAPCPAVGIFHDFNYRYYFGGTSVFSAQQRALLESEMPRWLDGCVPVVSTQFMARELAEFYPQHARRVRVVPLAPLGGVERVMPDAARAVVDDLGVTGPYLLYPTHMCTHKNVGPLLAALALLNGQGRGLKLVLTGAGTDEIRGRAHALGVRLGLSDPDVIGMGYVSNLQMNCLVQCASVVVSPSLYEAGNGPGLDAWGLGVPVAMSDIAPYREHVDTIGVRAQMFDPRSPQSIADSIRAILDDPDRAALDVQASTAALARLTWDSTAAGYLEIFRHAVESAGQSQAEAARRSSITPRKA
jgi:glycosyltransferase involved in cell wall biosynthesis